MFAQKFYRRVLSALLAVTMLLSSFLLFACTPENDGTSDDEDDAADEKLNNEKDDNKVVEDLYNGVIPEDTTYVIADGVTKRMIALSGEVKGNQARIAKFMKKAQSGEELTVAFVGGSITMGGSADQTSYDLCFAALTTKWIQDQFPDAKINHLNLGLNSTGSYINVHRLEKELLAKDPDLVFVDFSVNDTENNLYRNIYAYDSLLRKIWTHDSDPALITIGMTAETWTFQEHHATVCRFYNIPMISYSNAINDVLSKGYIRWSDISDDNIHPNVTGHGILSELITAYLQSVIDNLGNINTEKESNFSKSYSADKYKNADIISPADITYIGGQGWKTEQPYNDKTYNGGWYVTSEDGKFIGVSPIKFEVNAKSVGLIFKRYTAEYASFDVLIDGEYKLTITPSASYSFRDATEIVTFKTDGKHTVEIVPKSASSKATIHICALLVS